MEQASVEEAFTELTIDDLEQMLDESASDGEEHFVYFGRLDDADSDEFEHSFIDMLGQNDIIKPRYVFYSVDVTGDADEARVSSALEKASIDGVPRVAVIKGAKVLYKWDDPFARMSELKEYLLTGNLPVSESEGSQTGGESPSQESQQTPGLVRNVHSYDKLTSLNVKVMTADVKIERGAADAYVLSVEYVNHPGATATEHGGALTVQERTLPPNASNTQCTVKLSVPRKATLNSVTIEADTGSIGVSKATLGKLHASFNTGSIEVEDVRLGSAKLTGSSGAIRLIDIEHDETGTFDTGLESGFIEIRNLSGDASADYDLQADDNAGVVFHGEDHGTTFTRAGTGAKVTASVERGGVVVE